MRMITMMPVRNEAWILRRALQALCAFSDRVIVADQKSDDGTREILDSFAPKVVVIDNPEATHSTRVRWRLLEAARNYDGMNLLLLTDADEFFSANILAGGWLDRLASLKPGTAVEMERVNLWRDPRVWRSDGSAWTGQYNQLGFRDDRQCRYAPVSQAMDHNPRLPALAHCVRLEEIKLLHYQFVVFDRMLSKQRRYRAMEAVEMGVDRADEINLRYICTRDERGLRTRPLNPEWVAGWAERGIDLLQFEHSELYWYDVEVLRCFADKGASYFAPIDLWDEDWERKRLLALAQGCSGVPADPIKDPRSLEQRWYHSYLQGFFRIPPWRDPREMVRMPGRACRRVARAAGFRRAHLERFGLLRRRPAGTLRGQVSE